MSENQSANTKTATGDAFDITKVPNEDHARLASAIETFYKQDSSAKTRLSYAWERNQLFLDNHQWLVFDGNPDSGGGMWKRLNVSRANDYIPRPVTNYLFDIFQTLKAYLIKNKPRSTVRPNTQGSRDKAAAKLSELCLEANWERLHETENYEYAAACGITYGTVFKKSFWDTSSANMVRLPVMQQVPITDPETGMPVGSEEIQALDEMGEPLFESLPLGDVNTVVVEPFRMAIDPLASDLHNARWVMEFSIQYIDWIKETYGKAAEGYTGLVEEVKEEPALSAAMKRYYQLKNSSGVKSGGSMASGTGLDGDTELSNVAVVKEYYERPSQQHPKGRMIVVANGVCLYAGESMSDGTEQGDWHPFSEFRWEIVPGRFWGKSPFDAAVELQKRINTIDAVISLNRKTNAIPQKVVYAGSGIEPGQMTGRPGQVYEARSPELKPDIIPPVGIDPSVFQERAQCVEDLKNITGAIDILKGDRPPGVNAASALAMLYEVGTGKLFPTLDRWKRFIEIDQKKQLKLIAKNYIEPRDQYKKLLQSKNSDFSEETIDRFIGSDLLDNCNVIVEAGSNIPKLQSMQQARLQEAAAAGTLNLELPANRIEYNRQMGITGFDNDVGPDVKRAEFENDIMDSLETSPENAQKVIVFDWDNDDIHLEVLEKRMKEPSFLELPEICQQKYIQHRKEHQNARLMKMQVQMMEAMATGQQPMPQDGAGPTDLNNRGKGAPNNVREAMANADAPPMEGA